MTWPLLAGVVLIYLVALFGLAAYRQVLWLYVAGAFGLTFIGVSLMTLTGWDGVVQNLEARQLAILFGALGRPLEVFQRSMVLIPDPSGWTGLGIGIECSAIIESFVLIGLIMFYPRLRLRERIVRTIVGLLGTYALNMIRLIVIVLLITLWGKSMVYLAHAVIGRVIFFLGAVWLYWRLVTMPTLYLIRDDLAEHTQAAQGGG